MLARNDVERIIENALRDLSLSIRTGDSTDPNCRIIELKYKDRILHTEYFSVAQKDEYEG